MSYVKALTVLLFAALPCAAASNAQRRPNSITVNHEEERRSFAVNLARAINAAEANYKKNHDGYASWDILISSGDFSQSGTKWSSDEFPTVKHALYGSGPEVVPGWKLRLLVSANGSAYHLLLEDVNDPKCGYAVSSDERNQLRQSQLLSCKL